MHKDKPGFRLAFVVIFAVIVLLNGKCSAACLKAVGADTYQPLSFIDRDKPSGYAVELTKVVAQKALLDLEIELMDWTLAQDLFSRNEADLLVGINKTPEREAEYDFSDPLLENELSLFVGKNNFTINRESDLLGRRIGVEVGDVGDFFLKKQYPHYYVNYYRNKMQALSDLADGKLDVVLADYVTGSYAVDKLGFSNSIKVIGKPLLVTEYCIAVPKGRTELLVRINKGIAGVKQSGEFNKLQREWFGENYFFHSVLAPKVVYNIIKICLIAAAIIIFISVLFTYYARTKVERATEKLRTANNEVAEAYEKTVKAFLYAMEKKDGGTVRHSLRVNKIALEIGKSMKLSEEQMFYLNWGTLLHDIGKLTVSEKILLKPGPLTDDEYNEIKRHTEIGYDILRDIGYLGEALDVILYHHERWDGTGYPHGISGRQIPLLARICAVADAFEAMIADRPYRQGMQIETALKEMARCSGSQFDAEIVNKFMQLDIKRIVG